jgi:hypothetical protein
VFRIHCHDRIKQAKRSYEAALHTVNVLLELVTLQPKLIFEHELDLNEIRQLKQELHEVYFVRMFASFESSVRDYWRTSVRDTKPLTERLLNSVAGRRGVPEDIVDTVHEIRDFRNCLIHGDHVGETQFTIDEASRILNTYLARLPLQW